MEAVVYEDLPDASVRLARLRAALLAFVHVQAAAPTAVALVVPVALASTAHAADAAAARLCRACADRSAVRRWLRRCHAGLALDIWVAAAVAPRDADDLSTLAQWQCGRGGSPLRGADALCLSLSRGPALWPDGPSPPQQPPRPAALLLAHQSLLLDLSCCVGAKKGPQRVVGPAGLAPIAAAVARAAKGRTAAVMFYSEWLRAMDSARWMAQLQLQLRAVARHVLGPAQVPLCLAHGGTVESLQGKQSAPASAGGGNVGDEQNTIVSEALLACRAVQDMHCLAAVLLGHPQTDYYAEALAFCAAMRRRRRTSGMIAELCPALPIAAEQKEKRKRARDNKAATGAEVRTVSEAAEEPLWCEDLGR